MACIFNGSPGPSKIKLLLFVINSQILLVLSGYDKYLSNYILLENFHDLFAEIFSLE